MPAAKLSQSDSFVKTMRVAEDDDAIAEATMREGIAKFFNGHSKRRFRNRNSRNFEHSRRNIERLREPEICSDTPREALRIRFTNRALQSLVEGGRGPKTTAGSRSAWNPCAAQTLHSTKNLTPKPDAANDRRRISKLIRDKNHPHRSCTPRVELCGHIPLRRGNLEAIWDRHNLQTNA